MKVNFKNILILANTFSIVLIIVLLYILNERLVYIEKQERNLVIVFGTGE